MTLPPPPVPSVPPVPHSLHAPTLQAWHQRCCSLQILIDMTRGLPSAEQVALSQGLLHLPGDTAFTSAEGVDWRNYGGLQGLVEVRALFAPLLLGVPATQVAVGGNSSLALMHGVIGLAWRKGFPGAAPWRNTQTPVRFLCPVPGYDRHFAICTDYGIELVPVPMNGDGPDMEIVERRVAQDPLIRGMWRVPHHSNPGGCTYSETVLERLAMMPAAAADFTIFCDNAYVVHDFPATPACPPALHRACVAAGNPDRALVFASTSKMTIPGAGMAFIGGSAARMAWWLEAQRARTLGPDKLNQVRHLLFFGDAERVRAHMAAHGALLQARFACVLAVFERLLGNVPDVHWTRPGGGYFITLQVPVGCARRVVSLAAQAGVRLTPAGSTHCHGVDPQDSCLRIAPSCLSPHQATAAAGIVAGCVRLAAAGRRGVS